MTELMNLDGNILLWIQDNLRNDILTPIFKVITTLGDKGIFWIAVAVLLLILRKWKLGGSVSIALILMLIINNMVLKELIDRTRPYEVVEGLVSVIGPVHNSPSFPSGHTAGSFAAATVLFLKAPKRYGVPALILAVLIGFSRLYLGVHYPTDVLGGMVVGIICALLGIFIVDRIEKVVLKKKSGNDD